MLSESFYLKLATTCKNLFISLVVVLLVIFLEITPKVWQQKFGLLQRKGSRFYLIQGRLPSKGVLHLLPSKFVFHERFFLFKDSFPSKETFHLRLSFLGDCLPSVLMVFFLKEIFVDLDIFLFYRMQDIEV